MNWHHELLAGTFLVITLSFLGLFAWGHYQRTKRVEFEAAYTAQSVELEGARRALLAKPAEVVKFVEVPAAVKAAVHSGAMTPIAATKVKAEAQPIVVPCPSVSNGNEPEAESPKVVHHTNPVIFGITGEFFVGKIVGGAVEYTGSLKGTARMDATATDPAWSTPIEFGEDDTKVDIKVSTEIAKAVEKYEEPWTKKHLRFMCPGVFGGLDLNGKVTGGIGCAWGVVY